MKASRTAALAALAAGLFLGACEESSNPPSSTPPPKSTSSTPARPDTYTPPKDRDVTPPAPKDADNTAQNKSDRDSASPTPIDQSQAPEDLRITADIRKAILDDSSLSLDAHNCKIITTSGGFVILRGVTETQAEKDTIEARAKAVMGVTNVTNLLNVKGG